jgi:hypothetical protein
MFCLHTYVMIMILQRVHSSKLKYHYDDTHHYDDKHHHVEWTSMIVDDNLFAVFIDMSYTTN